MYDKDFNLVTQQEIKPTLRKINYDIRDVDDGKEYESFDKLKDDFYNKKGMKFSRARFQKSNHKIFWEHVIVETENRIKNEYGKAGFFKKSKFSSQLSS